MTAIVKVQLTTERNGRPAGSVVEVDELRAQRLVADGAGELVPEAPPTPPPAEPEAAVDPADAARLDDDGAPPAEAETTEAAPRSRGGRKGRG